MGYPGKHCRDNFRVEKSLSVGRPYQVTPETIMDLSQSPRGPFIIVRETLRGEELHDRRSGSGFYPEERGKTISIVTDHDLSERMPSDRGKREVDNSYRGPPHKVELFHV